MTPDLLLELRASHDALAAANARIAQLEQECELAGELCRLQANSNAEISAERDRLLKAGRYLLTCIGAATCDDPELRWTRKQLGRLFEHLRKEYPEFDVAIKEPTP